MLAQTGGAAHVANLGHGILPSARIECVEAFVETVRMARSPSAAFEEVAG
jgi:uroporphyrinogen-III decarboxylase